ncbi:MAG: ring-1,2-phenylacetyl-CoA epoxidase subunit PaaE [Bacteroidia bacterium]|jgi:ring-1,2-phenylacetyl-CoA epoxidase subunit PaaE
MPNGFYKLKVDKIIRETPDAVSIRLLVPPPLKGMFIYKAGQYLTLHAMINGEDVRRSYSVCSSPYEDAMPTVTVKQVDDGRMSTFLNSELKEGDLIDAMPPMGNFIVEPLSDRTNHYILFGGGSGITPLFSIARTVLGNEPNSRISLVYAHRDENSIIFKNAISEMEQAQGDRFKAVHILDNPIGDWNGLSGMLNTMKVTQLANQLTNNATGNADYFICGPSGLMQLVESTLEGMRVAPSRIHLEYFTALTKESTEKNSNTDEEISEGGDKQVTIDVYGDEQTINVSPDKTILEAAQDAGMDPPFSCTVGVCTTCRARVLSGKVSMDEREGLSDAEIEEGFVLTCQAHPLTNDVSLNYE